VAKEYENNGNNGNKDFQQFMNDLTLDGAKALLPELSQTPLISGFSNDSNPGRLLVANDDKLIDMLKIVYIEDIDLARNVAEALAECDEFLLGPDGKPHALVLQRIEWIKYLLAIMCSVKGRFADAYKQAATGVLTNAMSDSKGWTLLGTPIGKPNLDKIDHNNNNGKRP
jgi:hypothetical protein